MSYAPLYEEVVLPFFAQHISWYVLQYPAILFRDDWRLNLNKLSKLNIPHLNLNSTHSPYQLSLEEFFSYCGRPWPHNTLLPPNAGEKWVRQGLADLSHIQDLLWSQVRSSAPLVRTLLVGACHSGSWVVSIPFILDFEVLSDCRRSWPHLTLLSSHAWEKCHWAKMVNTWLQRTTAWSLLCISATTLLIRNFGVLCGRCRMSNWEPWQKAARCLCCCITVTLSSEQWWAGPVRGPHSCLCKQCHHLTLPRLIFAALITLVGVDATWF